MTHPPDLDAASATVVCRLCGTRLRRASRRALPGTGAGVLTTLADHRCAARVKEKSDPATRTNEPRRAAAG